MDRIISRVERLDWDRIEELKRAADNMLNWYGPIGASLSMTAEEYAMIYAALVEYKNWSLTCSEECGKI